MAQLTIPPAQVHRLQQVSLEMLLFFDRFCQAHDLTWYLCGGCCIGTMRTGSFIPWDDDVDVFMPRQDYEKLKTCWRDTPEYAIQFPTEKCCTANQFLTISDERTTFIKTFQKELDIRHGVMLDVLPLDGCPRGLRRAEQKLLALLYSLFVVGRAPGNHGGAVRAMGACLLGLIRSPGARYRAWRFLEKRMTRWRIEDCEAITELCSGPRYLQKVYPKRCFAAPVRRSFEGHMLCMPSDADLYLRIAFGDYMTLPPPEERTCHHEYEVLDLDHSYRMYRGKSYGMEEGKA